MWEQRDRFVTLSIAIDAFRAQLRTTVGEQAAIAYISALRRDLKGKVVPWR